MITLYRNKIDHEADRIEEKFNDLVSAYKVEELAVENMQCFIVDSDWKITGESSIATRLRELENELNWQRPLSGDGCYIHPEMGEIF